ncbi:MAG: mechanosensitive ion channel [Bacteroidetes bacterium]|nr:mechanosensitive ion channel [Bacteroidota bacterium]
MDLFLSYMHSLAWPFFTLLGVILALYITQKTFDKVGKKKAQWTLVRQFTVFGIGFIGFIMVLLSLPMESQMKGQLLGLIGIVLSAALALSSTTLLGNALASLMIRFMNPFKIGDFIRIEGSFGRVISRGIFHTEVQSEDRELHVIPNLILATKPMAVIRSTDVMVTAGVSLGYDVAQSSVKTALLKAAVAASLHDSFVFITDLGDFSVSYKVHGILDDPTHLLSTRSLLRSEMLNALHSAGIEIVSPTFMNQRQVNEEVFIPKGRIASDKDSDSGDDIIFDKANVAADVEKDEEILERLALKIKALEEADKKKDNAELVQKRKDYEALKTRIETRIEVEKKKLED